MSVICVIYTLLIRFGLEYLSLVTGASGICWEGTDVGNAIATFQHKWEYYAGSAVGRELIVWALFVFGPLEFVMNNEAPTDIMLPVALTKFVLIDNIQIDRCIL